MNVDDPTALRLLKTFSRLEFRLKKVPRFIQGDVDKPAMVQWGTVSATLAQLPRSRFLDNIPDEVRAKLIGERDRPKKQLVVMGAHGKAALFKPWQLPAGEAPALLEAVQRVRNNLFHGGKEDPDEGPYREDDQEWVEAAIVVVDLLLAIAGSDLA